jgi:hypothetical protein
MDTQEQLLNLKDLTHLYFENDEAQRAVALLINEAGSGSHKLRHLLRDHRLDPPITGLETPLREALDRLLAYYSILEIASQIAYIPSSLPPNIQAVARGHLEEPAIKLYYTQAYPLVLPQLFASRLRNERPVVEFSEDLIPAHGLFQEFLGLVNLQRQDQSIYTFLRFLDDGSDSIAETIKALRDPEALSLRLLRPAAEQDPLDRSVHGLQAFMDLCIELDDLLQRCAKYPRLQASQWHYYGYWFGSLKEKLLVCCRRAMDQIAKWSPQHKDIQAMPDKELLRGSLAQLDQVVTRLLFGSYTPFWLDSQEVFATHRKSYKEVSIEDLGREIDLGILPSDISVSTQGTGLEIDVVLERVREVNGDLYEVLRTGEDRVVVVVGDTSGHGIRAALFMAATTALIRITAPEMQQPEQILARVNDALAAHNPQILFVTLACAVFEPRLRRLHYASAGHPSPVLLRRGHAPVFPFTKAGLPAGITTGETIPGESLLLEQGDMLVFYTDGVFEAFNAAREQFGTARLLEHLAANAGRSPKETVDGLLQAVRRHAGDHPQSDDITILAAELA